MSNRHDLRNAEREWRASPRPSFHVKRAPPARGWVRPMFRLLMRLITG